MTETKIGTISLNKFTIAISFVVGLCLGSVGTFALVHTQPNIPTEQQLKLHNAILDNSARIDAIEKENEVLFKLLRANPQEPINATVPLIPIVGEKPVGDAPNGGSK
jgi:hypothetical protein